MGKLLGVAITPHPPIVLEQIGKGREREAEKTINGLQRIAKTIKNKAPELIVCITPHGNVFSDGICILNEEVVKGSLKTFGYPSIKMEKEMDIEFIDHLIDTFQEEEIPSIFLDNDIAKEYGLEVVLDHGVMVPLHFIDQQYNNYKLVHITIGMLKHLDLYNIGRLISNTIFLSEKDTLILVSGDLSHCLKDGPYEYNPAGEAFDNTLVDMIRDLKFDEILHISKETYKSAAECGLKPIIMGLGAIDGYTVTSQVFSYEGPFGVGYMNAFIEVVEKNQNSILEKYINERKELHELKKRTENIYVALARGAIEEWIHSGKYLNWDTYMNIILPKEAVEELENTRKGTFVSIHNNGNLRGCIGTITPTRRNLAEEIIYNAVKSASEDPRFYPIMRKELEDLEIKVDVLHDIEPISSIDELDAIKYGVVVEGSRGRRGLLLPNLEGVDTPQQQVEIAMEKADIMEGEKVKLYRFEVTRYQ